jgi:hypothetical protein
MDPLGGGLMSPCTQSLMGNGDPIRKDLITQDYNARV